MPVFEMLLKAIILAGLLVGFVQTIVLFFELYLRRAHEVLEHFPAVSILKPLKGLDDQLEANLRSFFELDYPEFEIIFGLRDTDDPARPIIEQLQESYPQVQTRLEINPRAIGLNPKVNTLHNILPFARYGHILISDSNVRADKQYLKHLVAYFTREDHGMVTSIVRGLGSKRIGSVMENLHLNALVAGAVLSSGRLFKAPVCIGKSLLIRKETLHSIGGIASFRNLLAEDYFMGKAVKALGMRVATANQCIDNVIDDWGFASFVSRHIRWAQMRLHSNRLRYASEFMINPLINALLFHIIWPQAISGLTAITAVGIKCLLDVLALRIMRSDLSLRHYLIIPFKDLVVYFIWFLPYLRRKVAWRGNQLRITKDTHLLPV